MREREIFRSLCRESGGGTADLYRREWVREGDRDREKTVPAGGGFPCHLFDGISVKTGDAAKIDQEAELWIDAAAPVEAGMKLCLHRSGGEEWFLTCGPAAEYPSHKKVRVRLERVV